MKLGTLFLNPFSFNDNLFAESPPAADGHDSFIKGLKKLKVMVPKVRVIQELLVLLFPI